MIPPIPHHHTVCQGCGLTDDPAVEAGGIYGCPNRHCLISGAFGTRVHNGYHDEKGRTSPAQALKWRSDLLEDLIAAAEGDDPTHLEVMTRSARRVAKHLGDILPGLVDEIRVAEELADGWDLADAMREYYGEEKFKAEVLAGVAPDAMAAGVLRKYAKGTHALHSALEIVGLTPDEKVSRFKGKTTLEIAAELIVQNAGAIQDRERQIRMGPPR